MDTLQAEATVAIPPLPELRLIGVAPETCGLEGRRMCYMEAGPADAPAVFLLHGIGSNSGGWRFVIDGLKDRYRVIAWNAPGYYLSDNLRAEAPNNFQYADALAALLDALGIQQAFVAGSSFGSLVAASFAARHPVRVRRLALLGTARGQKWLPPEERARRLQMREDSIRDGGVGLAETRWKNLIAANASPTTIRLTQEALRATHRRGFLQAARTSDTTDVVEFAGSIKAPTLVMVGTEDRVNPPEISRVIHGAIAGSRLVELEGIGHLPKLEAPARVVTLLREHFGNS
jgi:pimeloyl-ACP methyl ester carboxylesterase